MIILTGSQDESTIFVLADGSEIEVTIVELEGNHSEVVVCASEKVSITHRVLASTG